MANWTREEHILALNLYWQIPFGKMHKTNPAIIRLAELIERSPSSVGMKLGNFGRLDPALKARGISGLTNGAKGEVEVWDEFNADPESLAFESEQLRAKWLKTTVEEINGIEPALLPKEGKERESIVKVRVNQNFFRRRILSAYNYTCCITGLNTPGLLVAGHIIPWSEDPANRLNPLNGLCLNRLHDKLFEDGLMWIDQNLIINFSDKFQELQKTPSPPFQWLKEVAGNQLILSKDFQPNIEFLMQHAQKHGHA